MKILCDNCGAKYSIADEKVAGKVFRIRCKKCTNVITVRGDQVAAEEEAAAPQAFDYGGEQVWHVVVDGDQQGPFAPSQLGQMLTDGTIDWEAYVWKEGFDGWKPARDVPDLVAAITGEAPAEEQQPAADEQAYAPAATAPAAQAADPFAETGAAGGMGGDPFGGSEDPFAGGGDAFAAPQEAARATSDAGADLFASGGDAFGAADDDVVASAPSPRVSSDQAMTGQRNENSVLFSLSNLQALATGGAEPAGGSMPPGPVAGHATGEGSGLIDIRALASATAATSGSASSSGGSAGSGDVDDLLSIGGSGGLGPALGAPVLAPAAAEPEEGGKGMVIGLALAGVVVIGLLGALIFVITQQPAEQVSAATVPAVTNPATAVPAEAAAPAPATAATDTATETADGDDGDDSDDGDDGDEADDSPDMSGRRSGSRMGRNRPSGSSPTPSSAMADRDPDPAPMTTMRSSSNDSLDDLLGAALGGSSMMAAAMAAAPMSNLPETPSRDSVGAALRMVGSAVAMCGGGMAGTAQSSITFASSGRVRNVAVMGVPGPVQSCVSRAVRSARVPPFQRSSFNVNYPFRVR